MNRTLTRFALAAAVVALGVSSAAATCIPAKDFNTWNFTRGIYHYVFWGTDSAKDTLVASGAFWEPGNRAGVNEGTYSVDQWLKDYNFSDVWYLNGNMGEGGVEGCPTSTLVVAVSDPSPGNRSDFFVSYSQQQSSELPLYWFGPDLTFQPIPAPQVTSASRSGSSVILDLSFDDPSPGYYSVYSQPVTDVITEIVLYQAKGADAGRDTAAWNEIGRFPYVGGVTTVSGFTLDCSDPAQTYLAATLNMTNEYDLAHVSSSVVVECDPNLADPGDKFDLIRDRGKGQKRGKPFQN